MKIRKILNNNVVITLNHNGEEQVLMGKGLGFKKKAGDTLDNQLIEKVFSLNNAFSPQIHAIVPSLPLEIITTAQKIIELAQIELNDVLHESIYIALADHLHGAIERHNQGTDLKNRLLWEIKRLYPNEFAVAQQAITIIKQRLNVTLPADEAGFIAFHIINAKLHDQIPNVIQMVEIVHDVLHIIKCYFNLSYNENNLNYQRIETHLKFLAQRILKNQRLTSQDNTLFNSITSQYKNAYQCAKKIEKYLKLNYQYQLTSEDLLFLTIHIEKVQHID